MKKRIFAALTALVMLIGCSVSVFAASATLACDASYNADSNIVSVKIYIKDPGALEAADLSLAFDPDVYEYVECDESELSENAMVVTGKSIVEDGLATCSVIFMEACAQEDLNDEGDLMLVTFNFKPLTEDYDINDFCLWAESYSVGDVDIASSVSPVGAVALKSGHTAAATVYKTATTSATTTKAADENNNGNEAANDNAANNNAANDNAAENNANSASSSTASKSGTKWYVYVIAGVLGVGAVAGIAMIAIKSNHDDGDEKNKDDKKENNDFSEE